ncbi:TetR/AcrR family transcriptional regulator [Clostridiaceae bacterium 35-E11]
MTIEKDKSTLIIEAAMKIFCRDGFHKAKVSDIAAEAGIGKGTIYEYFDSKQQLFIKMVQWHIELYHQRLMCAIQKHEDIIEKLQCYISIEEEIIRNYGDLAQIFIREGANIGSEFHKIMKTAREKKIDCIASIIQEGICKEIFRDINPYVAALTFMGSVHHLVISKIFMQDDFTKQINIANLNDILLNGVKK